MPTASITSFAFGRDYAGRPSSGAAIIDEVRFYDQPAPHDLLQDTYRYRLESDLEFDEDDVLVLRTNALQMTYSPIRSSTRL